MNHLPDHRRVIHGRTHREVWDPCGWDPIRAYPDHGHWLSRLLAIGIGIALAVVLVAWIDWSLL